MGTEYAVRWMRLGLSPRSKLFQTKGAADRWALRLQGKMAEATGHDPEAHHCCPGSYECGCGGETWAEMWAKQAARFPPLVALMIDERDVGVWRKGEPFDLPEPDEVDAVEYASVGAPTTGPPDDVPF